MFSYDMYMKHTVIIMDPVWQTLPLDLANHVCNQLHKVRKIPDNLRVQICAKWAYMEKCKELNQIYNDKPWVMMGYGSAEDYEEEYTIFEEICIAWEHYVKGDE